MWVLEDLLSECVGRYIVAGGSGSIQYQKLLSARTYAGACVCVCFFVCLHTCVSMLLRMFVLVYVCVCVCFSCVSVRVCISVGVYENVPV